MNDLQAGAAGLQGADGEGQVDLLVRLYQGAVDFLNGAVTAAEAGDTGEFKRLVGRGRAIIEEFKKTLNFQQGGEVAKKLDELYDFSLDSLNQAELTHDVQYVHRVVNVLKVLLDGWQRVHAPATGPRD